MILILLVFLGGVLTILSPCILPVLPFVFARSEQRFLTGALPMLAGMAVTFAGIATLAAVGGAWAVRLNQYGRVLALVLLTAFAATLLSRHLADRVARPFVALGNRLLPAAGADGGVISSLLLGVATGLLWAPCAGPILGLVLTGAAISGPNTHTTVLLLAYAAGAAASLGVAVFAGGRVFAALKRSLGAGEWLRRGLGIAVLVAVAAIAFGWDTSILTNWSLAGTNRLEQSLLDKIAPQGETPGSGAMMAESNPAMTANGAMMAGKDSAMTSSGAAMAGNNPAMAANSAAMSANNSMMAGNAAAMNAAGAMAGSNAQSRPATANAPAALPVEGDMPSLAGATAWLNSSPLTREALRGKVVLVDFWTYSCINCLRSLPYVKAWYEKYKDHGLVVIGVHSPEFAFEKDPDNVRRAVKDLNVRYPVALDDAYAIWRGFDNHYWPAHYFIDAKGQIRGHHFGEGQYDESEQIIRRLLTEAGYTDLPASGMDATQATGVQAAADEKQNESGETYLGYRRAEGFRSPGGIEPDVAKAYALPSTLALNQWALAGTWTVDAEKVVLGAPSGKIEFRFHARDLHLVMGSGAAAKPVRFRVRLDGAAPGADHGADTDANGEGVIKDQRLYQLIRQRDPRGDHVFSIEFPDSGAQAYSFTFG